eukprot:3790228-Pyramimonas_sp.AAC.1
MLSWRTPRGSRGAWRASPCFLAVLRFFACCQDLAARQKSTLPPVPEPSAATKGAARAFISK